ncbi:MAG: PGPGW domain-containing protein [Verrucomicrobiota bacterium]
MEWLTEAWTEILSWITEREKLVAWVGALSLATLVISAIAVPIVIRRMPADYFLDNGKETEKIRQQHPVLRLVFLIVKNLVGAILVIGGIIMLVTPGQGLLTIVIGLILTDFPGKRNFEIRLVSFKPLNRAINWIRSRAGREPLILPE